MTYIHKVLENLTKEDLIAVIAVLSRAEDSNIEFVNNKEKIKQICGSCMSEYINNLEIPYIDDVEI